MLEFYRILNALYSAIHKFQTSYKSLKWIKEYTQCSSQYFPLQTNVRLK